MTALCSSSYTPLSQFTKHSQEDRGLQNDRLVSKSHGQDGLEMRNPMTRDHQLIENEFADFNRSQIHFPVQYHGSQSVPFILENLGIPRGNGLNQTWASEFSSGGFGYDHNHSQTAAYLATGGSTSRTTSPAQSLIQTNESRRQGPTFPGHGYRSQMGLQSTAVPHNYMIGMAWNPQQALDHSYAQSRTAETPMDNMDWETAFASLDTSETDMVAGAQNTSEETGDYSFTGNGLASEDAKPLMNQDDELVAPPTTISDAPCVVEQSGPREYPDAVIRILAKRAAADPELKALMRIVANREHSREQLKEFQGHVDECARLYEARKARAVAVARLLVTPTTDYRFQEGNPFLLRSDPYEEGMEILRNDGNLSFAVLAFEAACQQDLTSFDAWRMLGSVQSENEWEVAAIDSLNEALRLNPTSLDVMMKLAISHTNEGAISLAHEQLGNWLKTKYPQIPIADFGPTNYSPTFSQSLERMKEAFIEAAQLSLTTGSVDPDVQVGLGVLLFSAQHYQLAADCFASAIQTTVPGTTNTQSQLHLLWNRYGACLGNMKLHDEGIAAYEMALAIRPNFVRARYNLGLLYQNSNRPLEGAKHTLQALGASRAAEEEVKARGEMLRIVKVGGSHGRLERVRERKEPMGFYETLRKCCGALCRWDLVEAVGPGMDLEGMRRELDGLEG